MKISQAIPSIEYMLSVVEERNSEKDKKHIHKIKNFLRSREKETLSAGYMNGTGSHKKHDDNKDRGICI